MSFYLCFGLVNRWYNKRRQSEKVWRVFSAFDQRNRQGSSQTRQYQDDQGLFKFVLCLFIQSQVEPTLHTGRLPGCWRVKSSGVCQRKICMCFGDWLNKLVEEVGWCHYPAVVLTNFDNDSKHWPLQVIFISGEERLRWTYHWDKNINSKNTNKQNKLETEQSFTDLNSEMPCRLGAWRVGRRVLVSQQQSSIQLPTFS